MAHSYHQEPSPVHSLDGEDSRCFKRKEQWPLEEEQCWEVGVLYGLDEEGQAHYLIQYLIEEGERQHLEEEEQSLRFK